MEPSLLYSLSKEKGIIHDDIKPANMLLCSDGKIRFCDFAEARLLSEDPADWEGMTTRNYVSPHRVRRTQIGLLTGIRRRW
jgi:serine/threonine protein kinase